MDRQVTFRRALLLCGMLTLACGAAAQASHGLGKAKSFAFAIGDGNLAGGPARVADRLGRFDLVVVDGEGASAADVRALRRRGTTVLGYLSVGTIEGYRSWYPRIKRYRLKAWQDWKDEWFADVSRKGLRNELAGRIAPRIVAKHFDGLFLDNVDMIETHGHRAQREGMRKLVRRLAHLAHHRHKLLFAQNGEWGLVRFGIVSFLDGWNREDVTTSYDFDHESYRRAPKAQTREAKQELRRMARRGLFTTSADYTAHSSGSLFEDSIANSCGAGALPYVGDIGLTASRLPNPAITCG